MGEFDTMLNDEAEEAFNEDAAAVELPDVPTTALPQPTPGEELLCGVLNNGCVAILLTFFLFSFCCLFGVDPQPPRARSRTKWQNLPLGPISKRQLQGRTVGFCSLV